LQDDERALVYLCSVFGTRFRWLQIMTSLCHSSFTSS
jgi:hypothetical protein